MNCCKCKIKMPTDRKNRRCTDCQRDYAREYVKNNKERLEIYTQSRKNIESEIYLKNWETSRCPVVYKFECLPTGEAYYGSTDHLFNRKSHHLYNLQSGHHKCKALQLAYDTVDPDMWDWSIVSEHSSIEEARQYELFHIRDPRVKTFNSFPGKGPTYKSAPICKAFNEVHSKGVIKSPRDLKTKEVMYYRAVIDYPYHNLVERTRDNLNYLRTEALWYINADPFDDRIEKHAGIWSSIKQPDGRFFSNYGVMWFGSQQGYQQVVDELRRDPTSRKAVIPMLAKEHTYPGNPDMVCTKCISFRVSNKCVNMHVEMRSSDLAIGSSIDWPCFSWLHEMVACELGLTKGQFLFSTDSLHVYEKDWSYMEQVVLKMGRPRQYQYIEDLRDTIPHITDTEDLITGTFESPFGKWLMEAPL